MDNSFIQLELIEGFKKLKALNLEGSPAADMIQTALSVWLSSLDEKTKGWNEVQDKGRITQAFNRLIAEYDKWPTPSRIINFIPPRAPQKVLPKKSVLSPAQKAANRAKLNVILNQLAKQKRMQ